MYVDFSPTICYSFILKMEENALKRCVLIVPALEPNKDFIGFIDELLALHLGPIVVVDDGSGVKYRKVFRTLCLKENCTVLFHEKNKGKGASIKTAIRWCLNHFSEFMGVITVDCDGQHRPKDVKAVYDKLVAVAEDNLVLGVRAFDEEITPKLSRTGNRIASSVMRAIYSIDLADTQTGLRGFHRSMLDWLLTVRGDRYDYELNVLIEAKKANISFTLVPVDTVYFRGNIESHYRPFADSLYIARIMARGLLRYFASSLTSSALDLTLFILLTKLIFANLPLSSRILLGTLIARIFSSMLNYMINRRIVFSQDTRFYPTMLRFYTLWVCQLSVSCLLVLTFTALSGIDEVFIKMMVDVCLALISYQVQLRWVFKSPKHTIRR